MSNILDLDALAPEPKFIKINGKQYVCKPLTLKNLIGLARLEDALNKVDSLDGLEDFVRETMAPFIPGFQEIDFEYTLHQLRTIILFVQDASLPKDMVQTKQYTPEKKTVDSPKA